MSQSLPVAAGGRAGQVASHAKLSSRSPVRQNDRGKPAYPATTVILPPRLQSDSCSSLVSHWDIEREENQEEEEEITPSCEKGWQEWDQEEKRAPLAQFRRFHQFLFHLISYVSCVECQTKLVDLVLIFTKEFG